MEVLDKIINTSERLFMNFGLKSISMDDIAAEIGISKKTIYKHFSTKDRLIHTTLSLYLKKEKVIVRKIKNKSANAVEEIIGIAHHVIKMVRTLKPTLVFDLKKYHAKNWELIEKHHYEFIQDVIQKNLERGIKEELFRPELDATVIAKLYVGKNLIIADDSTFPISLVSREHLLREHLLYHLYGVLSEKGLKIVKDYGIEAL